MKTSKTLYFKYIGDDAPEGVCFWVAKPGLNGGYEITKYLHGKISLTYWSLNDLKTNEHVQEITIEEASLFL